MPENRRRAISTVMEWENRLGIRRSTVLFVTLWMTYRAFDWAAAYASATSLTSGLEAAAIIAAVTAPVTYLQTAAFKAYLGAKDFTNA
jgi:hypothetical protein